MAWSRRGPRSRRPDGTAEPTTTNPRGLAGLAGSGRVDRDLIPIRLKTDTCPASGADRADALWVADEEAPSRDARIDDGVIAVPDDITERVGPQELPDVLPRIELRSIGRQVQERDVLRRMRTLATLVPAGAVNEQDGVCTWRDLSADLGQVRVHRRGVGGRHDDCGTDAAGGTDGAEEVGGGVAIVAHHCRARANRRPDIGVRSLLTHPGLVLEPDLDRRASRTAQQRGLQQGGEVFLYASCAAASFFGWNGRGCSRVSPSWCSHLPTVLSCTSTQNRRATSSRRATQRHRTTVSRSGSGPATTRALSSSLCSAVSRDARPGLLRERRPSIPASL